MNGSRITNAASRPTPTLVISMREDSRSLERARAGSLVVVIRLREHTWRRCAT